MRHLIPNSSSRQVVFLWLNLTPRGFSENKNIGSSACSHVQYPRRSDMYSSAFASGCYFRKSRTSVRRAIREGMEIIWGWELIPRLPDG